MINQQNSKTAKRPVQRLDPPNLKAETILADFVKVVKNSVFTFFYWFDVDMLRQMMVIYKNKLE